MSRSLYPGTPLGPERTPTRGTFDDYSVFSPDYRSNAGNASPAFCPSDPSGEPLEVVAKPPSFRAPQSIVTVIVDKEEIKQTFVLHKRLAGFHSPFFAAAFDSQFIEGNTQTMRLEDVETAVFGLLVHWLYTQTVDLPSFVEICPYSTRYNSSSYIEVTSPFTKDTFPLPAKETYTSPKESHLLILAKLWMLAQRCMIPRLQNQVMRMLKQAVMGARDPELKAFLALAYEVKIEAGKEGAEMKQLAADRMAWSTRADELERWIKEGNLPEGMVVDIVLSLKKGHVGDGGWMKQFLEGKVINGKDYFVKT